MNRKPTQMPGSRVILYAEDEKKLSGLKDRLSALPGELEICRRPHDIIVSLERKRAAAVLLAVPALTPEALETCLRIRALPQGKIIPVLFAIESGSTQEAYLAGAADVLTPPHNEQILRAKLTQYLELGRVQEGTEEESRRTEKAWAEVHEFFMQAPVPMVLLTGPEHRYSLVNPPYEKMFGRTGILGKTVYEVFSPEELTPFIQLLDQVFETGVPYMGKELVVRLSKPDGGMSEQIVNLGYHPLFDSHGKVKGVLVLNIDVTEEVRARKVLENAKVTIEMERANLRNLFKQTPEMVCILRGPDHVFEFVNEAHIRALGFDATGMAVRVAQPESVEVHGILDNVYRTGVTADLHEIPVTVTDRLRYFNLTYAARRDEEGQVNGVMILGTEVTDQVLSRELLRESQEKLKFAVSSAKMGTWEVHLPSNKVLLSAEAQQIFGFEKEYATSDQAIDVFIHPEDRDHARQVLADAIASRTLYDDEYRIVRPSGEIRWLNTRGRAIYAPDGSPAMLTGVTMDITDRKQQAETLAEKTALLETIIENIPMGVVFAEAPSGKLIFSNKRYRKVWREELIPADNIEGYSEYAGFDSEGRRYEGKDWPLARAISRGEIILGEEVRVRFKDGDEGVISLSAAPVRDAQGRIIAGVVLSEDVTDRKVAEERLKIAKEEAVRANELKSAFLANMSHEIRTPLGAMMGFVELLRVGGLPPSEQTSYLDIIRRNGDQLTELINDVLEFSKIEAGHTNLEFIPSSPAEIASSVVSLLRVKANEKDLTLDFIADPSTPHEVVSDPTRIRQVLVNLIGNALKFTPAGGVRVRSFGLEKNGKRQVGFQVTDTGIGISPTQRERIFEVFVQGDGSMTRRFGGTGLGLALSRKLARALDGDIVVESSSPSGSTFLFTFSDHPSAVRTRFSSAPASSQDVPANKRALEGISVLVVDDAPDNRMLMSKFLSREGASVEMAENGQEGFEKTLAGNFDVVLMDIQMPVLDGYSATRRLREKGYKKPVIAITAHAMSDVRGKCLDAGCTDQLPKPIRPSDLVSAVAKYSRM